jgi:hypothetical protein
LFLLLSLVACCKIFALLLLLLLLLSKEQQHQRSFSHLIRKYPEDLFSHKHRRRHGILCSHQSRRKHVLPCPKQKRLDYHQYGISCTKPHYSNENGTDSTSESWHYYSENARVAIARRG